VIRGYTALIDPESVGLPLAAMMAITPLDPAHEYDIPERAEASIGSGVPIEVSRRHVRFGHVTPYDEDSVNPAARASSEPGGPGALK
jgi:hypothetical protein